MTWKDFGDKKSYESSSTKQRHTYFVREACFVAEVCVVSFCSQSAYAWRRCVVKLRFAVSFSHPADVLKVWVGIPPISDHFVLPKSDGRFVFN